jgi:polyisoprenyl-teichoic acid--peptidoglycan teichoic acid transferase
VIRRSYPLALACAVVSALVPGSGQALQRRWRAAFAFAVPTVLAGTFVLWALRASDGELLTWALDTGRLQRMFWLALGWAVVCTVAAADAAIHAWPRSSGHGARLAGAMAFLTIVLVATLPGVAAGWATWRQETAITTVFQGGFANEDAQVALPVDDSNPDASPVTAGEPWKPGDSSRWNIALLGGDAGPGRPGLRTDTMIVLSIDPSTGDAAMISIPRNLENLPMPAGPLRKRFPKGFTDLANALYPYVVNHPEVAPQGSSDPAATAVKGALAQLLGIPIHHYVLIDMKGFVDIIDALGGVTINVPEKVPSPGNPPGAKHRVPPSIGPGLVKMDGTLALAYARSRTGDSDYNRMQRQRCVLAAAAKGLSPTDLVRRYSSLVSAVEDSISSDLPPQRLADLAKLFGEVKIDSARTLSLTPPMINVNRPNLPKIRDAVTFTLASGGATNDTIATTTTVPPTTKRGKAKGTTTTAKEGTSGTSTVAASC